MKRLLLMLCSAAALAAPLAIAPPALAGTYHMTMDTSKSTDGWTLTHDNGFWGCSFSSRPGPCADADVPAPTSLRLFARGDVKAGDLAFWSWEGPPTVSIASGSVTVNYATTADTRVFMKARLRNFAYASQPQLHTASDDGTATWKIPAGNSNVGLFLTSLADHSFSNKWSNTLRVVSIDAMLRDDTAPVATVTGPLASGQWLNQAQAVCATVSASDAGSGVASSQLRDNLASVLDSHALAIAAVAQPGDPSYMHDLCLTPSHLSDGSHDLVVRVADAAGEAVEVPFTTRVDSHAPTAMATAPADTTQRQPAVSFSVDPGPSGLSDFQACGGRPADGGQRRGCLLPATGRPRLRHPHGHLERHRPGRQPPGRVLDVPGGGRRAAGPERCGTAGRQRQRAAPPAACLHARRRRQRHRSGDAARAARRVGRGAVRHADRRPLRLRPGGRPGVRPPHDQRFRVGPLRQRDGAAAVGLRRGRRDAAGAG